MFFPLRRTCPFVGLSRDAKILRSVVFPEPDSPIIAIYSPFSTEKERSLNISKKEPENNSY